MCPRPLPAARCSCSTRRASGTDTPDVPDNGVVSGRPRRCGGLDGGRQGLPPRRLALRDVRRKLLETHWLGGDFPALDPRRAIAAQRVVHVRLGHMIG